MYLARAALSPGVEVHNAKEERIKIRLFA
jgi:hypothetical protein